MPISEEGHGKREDSISRYTEKTGLWWEERSGKTATCFKSFMDGPLHKPHHFSSCNAKRDYRKATETSKYETK